MTDERKKGDSKKRQFRRRPDTSNSARPRYRPVKTVFEPADEGATKPAIAAVPSAPPPSPHPRHVPSRQKPQPAAPSPATLRRPSPDSQKTDEQIQRLTQYVKKNRQQVMALSAQLQEMRISEQRSAAASSSISPEVGQRLEEVERVLNNLTKELEESRQQLQTMSPPSSQRVETELRQDPTLEFEGQGEAEHRDWKIDRFLQLMVEKGASDLHLSVGCAPMFRVGGEIEPIRYRRLRQEDWLQLHRPIAPPAVWEHYLRYGDADLAYAIPDVGRFRVNLFKHGRGGGSVFRVIPTKIMTIDQLGLPYAIHRIPEISGGLILITGPTGSGKSTTMAAIINEINEKRIYHIITLEDPIEFVHPNKRSLVHQREIKAHSTDFSAGLRDAVREDPDLLLVGEMRDVETIRLALESAEKGLLVFGTLHTNNAAKTVDRIVNVFAHKEQEAIRSVLSETVRAVVAQQLLKKIGGGRVAAVEILFGSTALSNLIREGKTHQITSLIQTGQRQGMLTMDESLRKLVDNDIITDKAAFEKAIDKNLFRDPTEVKLEEEALRASQKAAAMKSKKGAPAKGVGGLK